MRGNESKARIMNLKPEQTLLEKQDADDQKAFEELLDLSYQGLW